MKAPRLAMSKKQIVGTDTNDDNSNTSMQKLDYNIALVGAVGSGKSALIVKYITKRFIMEYDPTLEDIYTKTDTIDGHKFTVNLMDTFHPTMQTTADESPPSLANQETTEKDYLQWANAFIVVYSITDHNSFEVAQKYLDIISQQQDASKTDIPLALVGNKLDLERYRTISQKSGENLAAMYDCHFRETSAAEDQTSVTSLFHKIIKDIALLNDLKLPQQPLFISEADKAYCPQDSINNNSGPNLNHPGLRKKSLKYSEDSKITSKGKDKDETSKKNVSAFKLFNKSFKIFS